MHLPTRPLLGALLAALLTSAAAHPATDPSSATRAKAARFWVDPNTAAARQAAAYRAQGRTSDARLIDRIATRPQATWLYGPDPGPTVKAVTTAAQRAHRTAVLVTYYIPHRDCGAYSSGGAPDAAAYRRYIDSFTAGLGTRGAYVVVEPDAVAATLAGCQGADPHERHTLLAYALSRIAARPHTHVYLDAGNASWITDVPALATALRASGLNQADGVALNVSNYATNTVTSAYAHRLLTALDIGAHYVIDTSRNGNGPYTGPDAWCNPPGRALGTPPTTRTDDPTLDAYLWVKHPGESDGICRGGPAAGTWWEETGLELARNAKG
ncbi:glycoside hydrolase family 6 protein [Streptomyces beihaiensis]|uniref:Glucanase n=1 Tax=Streptomyces beihaiensis TaxID=2984495 RepID=A0ABT3U4G3_9ACTN|nr:glycoside hydrolase family 6 protein [Streptomyces beihaiensis]MCX3064219.1 glycoside hydrolase family 6 protein [Streptomyces beihaiensis]